MRLQCGRYNFPRCIHKNVCTPNGNTRGMSMGVSKGNTMRTLCIQLGVYLMVGYLRYVSGIQSNVLMYVYKCNGILLYWLYNFNQSLSGYIDAFGMYTIY